MTAEKLPNIQSLLVDSLGNPIGTNSNPLISINGSGGANTVVDQGTPNTASNAWGIRLSNGTIFYDTVLGTQLPNSLIDGRLSVNVGVSVLPPDAATATNQVTGNNSLSNIDSKATTTNSSLASILANQTNKTQSSQITDGTNTATLLNAAPIGTEWGLGVRLIGSSVTVSNFPTDDDAGTPASAVPSKASYIGGVDSNNLLRGFAANAECHAPQEHGPFKVSHLVLLPLNAIISLGMEII